MKYGREYLAAQIAAQWQWVKDHGETLAGYVQRYGSRDNPCHYGDGGEAIFAADYGELTTLCRQWRRRGF